MTNAKEYPLIFSKIGNRFKSSKDELLKLSKKEEIKKTTEKYSKRLNNRQKYGDRDDEKNKD